MGVYLISPNRLSSGDGSTQNGHKQNISSYLLWSNLICHDFMRFSIKISAHEDAVTQILRTSISI